jgi:GTP cyclohydrolase II
MKFSSEAFFPTTHGVFRIRVATDDDGVENVVVYKGDIEHSRDIPVRIHSECLTSEVFNSLRCDCNEQLETALKFFEDEGRGLLIYLRQEGRGIGLSNKIRAYALQDKGLDTVEANEHLGLPVDARTYGSAAEILRYFRIESIRLLTNNPAKIDAMRRLGVVVTDRISVLVAPNHINHRYLETKKLKMNYMA